MQPARAQGKRHAAPNPARKYLYAIIAGAPRLDYGPVGIDGERIDFVTSHDVTFVTSGINKEKIRPERAYLAAHRDVLSKLLAHEETVLPIRFGAIVAGKKDLLAMLNCNRGVLTRQLKRVAGKVEMGLRVRWDVPNIFDYFVQSHPELRAARDHIFGRQGEPSQDERIELGRLFERLLEEERSSQTDKVEAILLEHCAEIQRNPPRSEAEVMSLACLIERGRLKEFESGVFEAARNFDNNFAFDYNGPWAAHSFAEMDLRVA